MSALKALVPIAETQATGTGSARRAAMLAFLADAQTEKAVQQALPAHMEAAATVRRGNIVKAIEALSAGRSPQILIVDISGVDLPVSQVGHLAEVCEPGVHVIVVGDRNEVGLYRDLMQAGVSDYLVKPVTAELLRRAIENARGDEAINPISQKVGKLVTTLGTRGGVGTTSVAVNLAWFLANNQGRRVALLDLDLQTGDCAMMLGVTTTAGLREALESPYRIDERFLERTMTAHGERLFVLSAEEALGDELRFTPEAVETLITSLQSQFHYVIVDLPRTPSALSQRVIDLATLRVIVADESIRSAREIIRLRPVLGEPNASRQNLLVVNRAGEKRPGYIPGAEFLGAVSMTPAATIPPLNGLHGGAAASYGPPAVASRGRMADAIEMLSAQVSGRPVDRKWWQRWR